MTLLVAIQPRYQGVSFIGHYLDYMQEHEERMEDSFIYTIGDALEPFCKKQDRKSEPAFYLEEDRHKKKS